MNKLPSDCKRAKIAFHDPQAVARNPAKAVAKRPRAADLSAWPNPRYKEAIRAAKASAAVARTSKSGQAGGKTKAPMP